MVLREHGLLAGVRVDPVDVAVGHIEHSIQTDRHAVDPEESVRHEGFGTLGTDADDRAVVDVRDEQVAVSSSLAICSMPHWPGSHGSRTSS